MTTKQLVIIGDTDTGKTQLIHHHCGYDYEPSSTIGASYVFRLKSDWLDACWDMSGQKRFSDLHPLYYRSALGVVVVFDLSNEASFSHVEQYVNDAKKYCSQKPFIILVGNKSDLEEQRKISQEQIDVLKLKLQTEGHAIVAYVQTSAITGSGVDELFIHIKQAFTQHRLSIVQSMEHTFFAQPSLSKSETVDMEVDITDEEMAEIYLANRKDELIHRH